MSRPVVAVVGSAEPDRRYGTPIQDALRASDAATELGRTLARDYDLMIFTPDPRFLERDVLNGFCQARSQWATAMRRVIVTAARDVAARLELPGDEYTTLVRRPDAPGHWSIGFYRALLGADAVLLIGGDRTARIAGTICLAQQKPVLAVAAFGGATSEIWNYLNASPNDATTDDIAAMGGPWTDGAADDLVGVLDSQMRRRAERQRREARSGARATIRGGRFAAAAALLIAVGLLPVAAFLVELTSWKAVVVACGAAIFSAVGGALTAETRSAEPQLGQASLEGLGAGILAAFLYVVSQVASTPAFPTAEYTAPRLLVFLIPIGFVAGFSFKAVLGKAADAQVVDFSLLGSAGNSDSEDHAAR